MSDTAPLQDGARPKKGGGRTVFAVLFLLVAVAALAVAFWYVGGVD